jgi:cell division protein ZapE
VVPLGGSTDHRRRLLDSLGVYYTPLGEEAEAHLARLFEAMTKASYAQDGALEVGGRSIRFRRRAKGVVWFDFAELFERARSQVDYLEIASAYHTVLVSGVRRLAPAQTDVIRRFTWLVDVFYDQRVKLVCSAEAQPEELVLPAGEGDPAQVMVRKEFGRTASRLREMQSRDYFSRRHASAENPGVLSRS